MGNQFSIERAWNLLWINSTRQISSTIRTAICGQWRNFKLSRTERSSWMLRGSAALTCAMTICFMRRTGFRLMHSTTGTMWLHKRADDVVAPLKPHVLICQIAIHWDSLFRGIRAQNQRHSELAAVTLPQLKYGVKGHQQQISATDGAQSQSD